ncbi:fibronectin-like [Engraulis encrasicolus]|uniref:fibronectin-like n=1 Tax=Engraulis encrasicolus TaxID=184585 RepID=UPI002FD4EA3C
MGLTSVSVSWRKPPGVDQASYLLTLNSDGDCMQTISVKSTQHQFTELDIGREYSVSVSMVLQENYSKPICNTIYIRIPVPENVIVGSVTATSADLSWSLQQGMQKIPHRFLISYCSEETEPQTMSTESYSATLTGLQPDTQYRINICCELKDLDGQGEKDRKSKDTTITFQTAVPPPGPIEFTSVMPDSVCLRWGPPEGLTRPHTFRVSWAGKGIQEQQDMPCLQFETDGLAVGEEYTFTVTTVSEDREGPSVSKTVLTGLTSEFLQKFGNEIQYKL